MDIKIEPRWESLVSEAVNSGRYASREEVVNEAMKLLANKERRFQALQQLIDEAYEEEGVETTDDVIAAVEAALAEIESKVQAG